MRFFPYFVLCLFFTAGCTMPSEATSSGDTDRPQNASAFEPILSGLSQAEIASELEPGAGCSLRRDQDELMTAVAGDAIAKVDGEIVHFKGAPDDLNAMVAGGRYAANEVVIKITLAPDLGEGDAASGTFTKPVRVTARDGRRTERFEAVWVCGS